MASYYDLSAFAAAAPSPPPSYTRAAICLAPSRFGGGVVATTEQLGTVPSWGPEVGMLANASDRIATYQAHQAAGGILFIASLFCHYQEANVSYPNNTAANNDWTGNGFSQAAAWANEVLENGGIPCLHLGGDEKGTQWVIANAQAIVNALGGIPCALIPCFDSDGDADWSDPNDGWAAVNLALRAAMPNAMVLMNELPNGWVNFGTANPNIPAETFQAAAACVDAWTSEFPTTPSEWLEPWPQIVTNLGAVWDDEHGVYQPSVAQGVFPAWQTVASPWLQFVQVIGRRARAGQWKAPADVPYSVPGGLGIGGPQNGQPVTVSADEPHPPTATQDSSRGTTYYRGDEIWTYPFTHQGWPFAPDPSMPAKIDAIRAGLLACGVDATG